MVFVRSSWLAVLMVVATLALAPSASAQTWHYCRGFGGQGWRVSDLGGPRSLKCGSIRRVARRWVNASWCRVGRSCRFRVPARRGNLWGCTSYPQRRRDYYETCNRRDRYVTFNYVER
jgi:hypothetical protein